MKIIPLLRIASLSVLVSMASVSALASDAYGEPFEGWGFVKDDWQVVCDNTLTCRAAGYADESQYDTPASILLTVMPEMSPTAQIQFLPEAEQSNQPAKLWLNNKNYGNLRLNADRYTYDLSAAQVEQIIRHARLNTKIEIRVGRDSWTISDDGMSAVLLKLDDIQGRIGTPLALMSKNSSKRFIPRHALAKPIIKQAFSYSEDQQLDAGKLAYFKANINRWVDIDSEKFIGSKEDMGECELINPNSAASISRSKYAANPFSWEFTPIDASYTLASHICWQGAYNVGSGYWLIDHANPSKPKFITTAGNDYYEGKIDATHKDRGVGDCWNRRVWTWNGSTFVKSEESTTGLCRGFAGGAWDLPTYVSDVIKPKAHNVE